MLPFVDGFHWTFGHILFLTAFGMIAATMAVTMLIVLRRVTDNHRRNRVAAIQWQSDFHELGESDRRCRHELSGRVESRECHHSFDCGQCSGHAKFSAALAVPAGESGMETFGLAFPSDRLYHRGHTWVRIESDGLLTIGLDDFGRRLLGKPDRVELPEPGTEITAYGPAWHAYRNGAGVRILSPAGGVVVETGGPDQDWYLKIRPRDGYQNLTHLLSGAEVSAWLRRELERLQVLVAPAGAGASLADGGVLMEDLPKAQPEANWDAIYGKMFLAP